MKKPETIDEYIAAHPPSVQRLLEKVRETIQRAAPDATETISYGMPAFRLQKIVVYFAAYAHHIGFYPTASGIKAVEKELTKYKWSKGAIQFPIDKPIPTQLISKIVSFRVKEICKNSRQKTIKTVKKT